MMTRIVIPAASPADIPSSSSSFFRPPLFGSAVGTTDGAGAVDELLVGNIADEDSGTTDEGSGTADDSGNTDEVIESTEMEC